MQSGISGLVTGHSLESPRIHATPASSPGSGGMPFGVMVLFGYHALLLLSTGVAFALWLILTAMIPAFSVLVGLVLMASFVVLFLAILLGTWNRRSGAWFGMALVQLIIIPTSFIELARQPNGGFTQVNVVYLVIAMAVLVYLLTPKPKSWFRIIDTTKVKKTTAR